MTFSSSFLLRSNVHVHLSSTLFAFQIWRLITAFVFYPITPQTGFHYLINMYFLYSYSTRLETGKMKKQQQQHQKTLRNLYWNVGLFEYETGSAYTCTGMWQTALLQYCLCTYDINK